MADLKNKVFIEISQEDLEGLKVILTTQRVRAASDNLDDAAMTWNFIQKIQSSVLARAVPSDSFIERAESELLRKEVTDLRETVDELNKLVPKNSSNKIKKQKEKRKLLEGKGK